MAHAARNLPEFEPVIAGAPGRQLEDYQLATQHGIRVEFGQTRSLMTRAAAGLITSGTATLEAALLGLPHIICYKTSGLTYRLAKILVRTPWIGLPNLLLERSAVVERIQGECTPERLAEDVRSLHNGIALGERGHDQKTAFQELSAALKMDRPASVLVAESILHAP